MTESTENEIGQVDNVGGPVSAARAYHKAWPAHSHSEHARVVREHTRQGQHLLDLRDEYDYELLHCFYKCVRILYLQ